jgi:hypothetical protein
MMIAIPKSDRALQLELCDRGLFPAEEVFLWGRFFPKNRVKSWFYGVLVFTGSKWTIVLDPAAKRPEIRIWLRYAKYFADILKQAKILRIEGQRPYRQYFYFDTFFEEERLLDVIEKFDIKASSKYRNAFYERSIESIGALGAIAEHAKLSMGKDFDELAFDLGRFGHCLDPEITNIAKAASVADSVYGRKSRSAVPIERLQFVAGVVQLWQVYLPSEIEVYVRCKDFINRRFCDMADLKDIVPDHIRSNYDDYCDTMSSNITEHDRDEIGHGEVSCEHLIDYEYVGHVFDAHAHPNLLFIPHKYHRNLPRWKSVKSGQDKLSKYIDDGVFSKDGVVDRCENILSSLCNQHEEETDKDKLLLQKKVLDEIEQVVGFFK